MTAMIYVPVDRETVSSLAASVGLTAAKLPPTVSRVVYAVVQAVSGNVRFDITGATPSLTLGLRLLQDAVIEVWGAEALNNFRAIDDGGVATLEVIYMGGRA